MCSVVAVGKQGQALGELRNPHGVAVDENTGSIYVTNGFGSSRVSVFSETGELLNSFSDSDMYDPYGIALHRDNIYVTECVNNKVIRFKMEQQIRHVATFESEEFSFGSDEGSSDEQLHKPCGITVSTDGDVFVADYEKHRIKILDESLRFKRNVTHQSMKGFNNPLDVKLSRDEMFVLCESSPCVLVFSYAGEMTRSLVTQVSGANFFCLDAEENLFFSDRGAHCVKIFSKDGILLNTIGQEGQERGMLYQPEGIALTKSLNLVIVSNNKNFGLQIFSCK